LPKGAREALSKELWEKPIYQENPKSRFRTRTTLFIIMGEALQCYNPGIL